MSLLDSLGGTAIGVGGTALAGALQTIFVRSRSIGGFIADVTIEERHEDTLAITTHPVERGANISDHAYKQPAKVTIRCGWSNSSLHIANAISTGNILGMFDPDYVRTIYQQFLDLQASRQPFTIVTGKRLYLDMLIARLMVVTDGNSENGMIMICECQEVTLADTKTATVPPSSNMANPHGNAGIANGGTKQLSAVN